MAQIGSAHMQLINLTGRFVAYIIKSILQALQSYHQNTSLASRKDHIIQKKKNLNTFFRYPGSIVLVS